MNDWKKLELFERESQILSGLNHPAIPQYIDYFQVETDNDNSFYLIQQLAPGKSLAELIESGWNPKESEVKDIAIQILDILIYLQSFSPSIIHRDIKPENIILDKNGKVFLVDFGAVADTYHNTVTGGSTVVGTFGYMAPEQFRGKAFPSTDLYGLGTTLLYLLTKKHPSDLPQKHLKIDFRSQIKIKLSDEFIQWLDNIIEPITESRFSNAEIALAILQGRESFDNYSIQIRKPKNTPISLFKNEKELHIEIPAGKFRGKYGVVLAIISMITNGFLLLICLTTFQNFSYRNIVGIVFVIFFIFPCLVFGLIKSKILIIHPLSRIKFIIKKNNNEYTFNTQKSLLFLPYHYCQDSHSFGTPIYHNWFTNIFDSIKSNLTLQEYRWLKAEMKNFVDDKSIM